MKLKGIARQTPLIQSMYLSNNTTGGNVYLKLENMQFTGSFKYRGAANKVMHLTDEEKAKGIITASAGNHAQGLALTGNYLALMLQLLCQKKHLFLNKRLHVVMVPKLF